MSSDRPVLPPPPPDLAPDSAGARTEPAGKTVSEEKTGRGSWLHGSRHARSHAKPVAQPSKDKVAAANASPVRSPSASSTSASSSPRPRTRTAHLRLTRVDPVSVMKMTFLLAIALGIVMVVAVTIIWSVLSAVGVWDNINSAVQQVLGTESGQNFDVSKYIGTSRVIGFSLIASVINVVLVTAIATLAAFVYNLAAALLGGVEMTWTEDR